MRRIIEPGPRHWDIVRRLCLETGTTGPRTTDAWLAALTIESGYEWITTDRVFGRFPGLGRGGQRYALKISRDSMIAAVRRMISPANPHQALRG